MKRIIFGLVIALALPGLLFAQAKSTAPAAGTAQVLILEFTDGTGLTVRTPDGSTLKYGAGITDGDKIPAGSTIVTDAKTTAELRLKPNGTIIKVARSTTFQAQALATSSSQTNVFALAAGKVRTIAAKGGQYDFKSATAVCGVRGTDFTFSVEDGAKALLMVAKGLVEFDKLDASGNPVGKVDVGAGMAADAFAAVFEAFQYSADQFASEFGDMGFQKLIETDVPGQTPETGAAAPAVAPAGEPGTTQTTPTTAEGAAGTLAEGAGKMTTPEVESALMKWLREVMGMELGSVTINGTTYSKAILQPNFRFANDKLKFGLYLPIIYTSNMFDATDWYNPNGNDEWSFGTDIGWKEHPFNAALDAVSDIALKFKYFEYGRQLEDPFFIKLGNLDDLTLGHGLIMRNYSNDGEFPAVRRVGFNLGLDMKSVGFELVANDLADPQIFGSRLYIRPIKDSKFALGISGVVDINPLSGIASLSPETYGNPLLIAAGLDLDLPIIEGDFMSLRLFAEGAAETEWLRDAVGDHDAGLALDLLYSDGSFKNWGAAGGLMGRVAILNWRLEYRYYTGIFRPSLFDSTYDKSRVENAIAYSNYITSGGYSDAPTVMGVYGEGSFSIMKDKLSMTLGYMWPWTPGKTATWQLANAQDEFHARLVVQKGLIPIFDVAGAIFYDKHGLVQSIRDDSFQFLDANTSFGGELVIPVPKTPMLDVAVIFAAVPERNDKSGQIVLGSDGLPTLKPSISFETRLHF